jgi:hypothetical protein
MTDTPLKAIRDALEGVTNLADTLSGDVLITTQAREKITRARAALALIDSMNGEEMVERIMFAWDGLPLADAQDPVGPLDAARRREAARAALRAIGGEG